MAAQRSRVFALVAALLMAKVAVVLHHASWLKDLALIGMIDV